MCARGRWQRVGVNAALLATPLVGGDVLESTGIRRSIMFGWFHREPSQEKSSALPPDAGGNINKSKASIGNQTELSSDVEIDFSGIHVQQDSAILDAQSPNPSVASDSRSQSHQSSKKPQHKRSRATVFDKGLQQQNAYRGAVVKAQQAIFSEGHQQGFENGFSEGVLQGQLEGIRAATEMYRLTLYLPEFINGLRVITEAQHVGHYLLDMSVVHGGPGAEIAFRNTRQMADRHAKTVIDGSVLEGTLRDGWLETEVEVKPYDCSDEFTDGRGRGFHEGNQRGFVDGHKQGSEQGIEYGYAKGFDEGVESGREEGQENWYLQGYVHGYNGIEFDNPEDIQSELPPMRSSTGQVIETSALVFKAESGQGFGRLDFGIAEVEGFPHRARDCMHCIAEVIGGVKEARSGPEYTSGRNVLPSFHFLDHLLRSVIILLCGSQLLCIIATMLRCHRFISRGSLDGAYSADIDKSLLKEDDAAPAASTGVKTAGEQATCNRERVRSLSVYEDGEASLVQSAENQVDTAATCNACDRTEACNVSSDRAPKSPTKVQSLVQQFEMSSPHDPHAAYSPRKRPIRRSFGSSPGGTDSPVKGWNDWEARLGKLGGVLQAATPRDSGSTVQATVDIDERHAVALACSAAAATADHC